MKAIELSEVSALAPHVKPGCEEPLLLTSHGKVVATIVPADEHDAESMLLSINPQFLAILERSRQRLQNEGAFSNNEVRKRLGISAKAGRQNRRTKYRPGPGGGLTDREMEMYTFSATIAARWGGKTPQVQIVPDDPQAYLAWRSRVGLTGNVEWNGPELQITVSAGDFVARCEGVRRVRYTVRRAGRQMRAVDLQPIE
jgi:antitoxin (DNA-binding transcriptional repressor) of toxin-antitoxin stability system